MDRHRLATVIMPVAISIEELVALSRPALGYPLARRIGGEADGKAAPRTPVG
jgi:hypothetical protein